ncbi:helix-turn-helix domain-containing protein [uncultured Tyzzerella sp.]|uniref:winged helix-turn-helix transcriptional regulator n=1 Tax=uncultured Tyzzerella sp. TaxID=2321398 RepID=UPI002941DC12|nr:helix-turn-helix domain-containing protein [uncultured Tyzzerella sp.]
MGKVKVTCEMEVTLKMISGKYKLLILESLIKNRTKRFSQLMSEFNNISQRTLTNQLRELEQDSLIERIVYAEVPPRVEYSITDKGYSLKTILELMCEWGKKNTDNRFEFTNTQYLDNN